MEQPHLISLKEAAYRLRMSHSHLRLLARDGKFEAVKMGRDWFTTEEAVADYLEHYELRKHDPYKKKRNT